MYYIFYYDSSYRTWYSPDTLYYSDRVCTIFLIMSVSVARDIPLDCQYYSDRQWIICVITILVVATDTHLTVCTTRHTGYYMLYYDSSARLDIHPMVCTILTEYSICYYDCWSRSRYSSDFQYYYDRECTIFVITIVAVTTHLTIMYYSDKCTIYSRSYGQVIINIFD